jgi:GntR family transcriptional regulator
MRMTRQIPSGAPSLDESEAGVRASNATRADRRAPEDEPGIAVPAAFPSGLLVRQDGPLYRQLAASLRKPIEDGSLPPGSALPREADLAERFGVSLITVRQALRELETEGIIRKRAAKPAIVVGAEARPKSPFEFQSFAAIAASTKDRHLQITSYRKERSTVAAKAFGLAPNTACDCLRAILLVKDLPVGLTTFYFPPDIGSRLKRTDFDDVVVFRSVQRHLGLTLSDATITVRAEIADAALAKALDFEVGGPILAIEMLYRSADGAPVELTINQNRADQFSLSYNAPNDLR